MPRSERIMKRALGACYVALLCLLFLTRYLPDAAAQGLPADYVPQLWNAFHNAVYDAAVYRRANVRQLRYPLRFDPQTDTVRVATVTDYDGYHLGENTLGREIWVTAVPEVRIRCMGVPGDLALFLRMLLGLHPDAPVKHFVLFDVHEGDIFRPAADPDPTRPWPCADPAADRNCGENLPADAGEEHVRWMAEHMLSQYVVIPSRLETKSTGYPWTRLGYTYNWRPGAEKYGASEYVMRKGAVVNVAAIVPFQEYCRAGR